MSLVALSAKEIVEKKKKNNTQPMEKGRTTLCDETTRKSLGRLELLTMRIVMTTWYQYYDASLQVLMDPARSANPLLPTSPVYGDFITEAARGYGQEEMERDDG
ncbi:uncharacterized protein A4U43_C05F20830 [Asparagus officinalis]|uniref:Uncharacterized protein n=1 Tax=Asparagus officinalis TaxID=4686 RepID=A0A5P1ETW3_ASPOF|nr:uncharacterized protein A4U43_C05F20830 [Asparagus officinalis]